MKTEHVQWGIIGTSPVAGRFIEGLAKVPQARLCRVAGSSPEKARAFAGQTGHNGIGGRLDELLVDPAVDIVYIASPTRLHKEHALSCLQAGKSVLCEKPFTSASGDFKEIVRLAKEKGLFCMEGMWLRFNPLVQRVSELVRSGALGEIRMVRAECGYAVSPERLRDPCRGPVWDYGVYGLSLLQMLLGQPEKMVVTGNRAKDDPQPGSVSVALSYENATASLIHSVHAELSNQAEIVGTKGRLVLGPPFFGPSWIRSTVPLFGGSRFSGRIGPVLDSLRGEPVSNHRFQQTGAPWAGFAGEASEATRAVMEERCESPIQPLADTLGAIELAESIQQALRSA